MTPARLLSAGTLGSTLIALGGTGVGALPPTGWGLLRGVTPLALGLVIVGIVLLSGAWWALREGTKTHLLLAAGLWSVPLLFAPPLASRDAYAYVGQGALVIAGLDPYSVGPAALPSLLTDGVDNVWRNTPSPYGPLWLGLSSTVVRVTGSVVPALIGMRVLAVVGLLLVAWALPRLAARHDVPAGRALWLGLANPLVLVHLLGGAHNEALMIGLMLAGLAVAFAGPAAAPGAPDRWRFAAAAALVTAAALVKFPAVAALAYLPLAVPGWGARARAAVAVGAAALLTGVGLTAVSGLGWGWLGTLDGGRSQLSMFSPLTGLGLLLPGGTVTLDVVLALGMLAAVTLGAALLLSADRLGPVQALGLTLLAVSLLLPVMQPWYVLWGVMLLGAVSSARTTAALGVLCLVLVVLINASGSYVLKPPLYGVPTLLALAAAGVMLRSRRSPERVEVDG